MVDIIYTSKTDFSFFCDSDFLIFNGNRTWGSWEEFVDDFSISNNEGMEGTRVYKDLFIYGY